MSDDFICYLPMRFIPELSHAELVCMMHIFRNMRLNKSIDNAVMHFDDFDGISRVSFFNAMKSLTKNKWIHLSKNDKFTYLISLNKASGHYTERDYVQLTKPHMKDASPLLDNIPTISEPIHTQMEENVLNAFSEQASVFPNGINEFTVLSINQNKWGVSNMEYTWIIDKLVQNNELDIKNIDGKVRYLLPC